MNISNPMATNNAVRATSVHVLDPKLPISQKMMRAIRKDGTRLWISVNGIFLQADDAGGTYIVATIDDITQARASEEKILSLTAELEAANERAASAAARSAELEETWLELQEELEDLEQTSS